MSTTFFYMEAEETSETALLYFDRLYVPMYTRVAPYAFGMWVGFLHFKNREKNYCQGVVAFISEWVCFLFCIFYGAYGAFPAKDWIGIDKGVMPQYLN